jgi:hypothetical protein
MRRRENDATIPVGSENARTQEMGRLAAVASMFSTLANPDEGGYVREYKREREEDKCALRSCRRQTRAAMITKKASGVRMVKILLNRSHVRDSGRIVDERKRRSMVRGHSKRRNTRTGRRAGGLRQMEKRRINVVSFVEVGERNDPLDGTEDISPHLSLESLRRIQAWNQYISHLAKKLRGKKHW